MSGKPDAVTRVKAFGAGAFHVLEHWLATGMIIVPAYCLGASVADGSRHVVGEFILAGALVALGGGLLRQAIRREVSEDVTTGAAIMAMNTAIVIEYSDDEVKRSLRVWKDMQA